MTSYINLPKCGGLELILGPMFSGKSKMLIDRLAESVVIGKNKACFVRAGSSDRGFITRSKGTVTDMSKMNITEFNITPPANKDELPKIDEKLMDQLAKQDIIGFDEGHCLDADNLSASIVILFKIMKKTVVVAGIDGFYNQKLPKYLVEILPHSTEIFKSKKAICFECVRIKEKDPTHVVNIATVTCLIKKPAIITNNKSDSKIDNKKNDTNNKKKDEKELICVGDSNIYEARCPAHYA